MTTFVSGCCEGEKCFCGAPAAHKVEETIFYDDPYQHRHPLTRYICDTHFKLVMGPAASQAEAADIKLISCPFCGGGEISIYDRDKTMFWASCRSCGLETPTETGFTHDDAVTYWNTRATPAQPAGMRENDRHYFRAILKRLEQLYDASAGNARLREQLSDEVDWVDAALVDLVAGRPAVAQSPFTPELMNQTTVSCSGKEITIQCNNHEVKDALMDILVHTTKEG